MQRLRSVTEEWHVNKRDPTKRRDTLVCLAVQPPSGSRQDGLIAADLDL